MEQITNEIRVFMAGEAMGDLSEVTGAASAPFTRHFTQAEEPFLEVDREIEMPRLPIHHDVRDPVAGPEYLARIREILSQIAALQPLLLRELTWFFDPTEILKPCLFRICRVEESMYLYLLRLDLMPRPLEGTILERGTNDLTPRYQTRKLFLEPVIMPLAEAPSQNGRVSAFRVLQLISQTWIGEFGRGYFQQGIWMDLDLTKFFSRLFVPAGVRLYPYYPFQCRYRTVCHAPLDLSPSGLLAAVPRLHRVVRFLGPVMSQIEQDMRHASFSEELPLFQELKARVPESWCQPWQDMRVEAYLNEFEAKEYRIDGVPRDS